MCAVQIALFRKYLMWLMSRNEEQVRKGFNVFLGVSNIKNRDMKRTSV